MGRKAVLREKYNVTSAGYDELYREEQFEKYKLALNVVGVRGTVLDDGCGTGLLLEYLKSTSKLAEVKLYICLDLSPGMLERAKSRISMLNLRHLAELVEADAENIPLRVKSIDYTLSFTVIDLVDDKLRAINEIDRVTKTAAVVTSLKKAHSMKACLPNYGRYVGETSKDYIFIRFVNKLSKGSDG